MSRDHDAPVEYLRKLASLKLRFGLALLGTANGTLPVGSPMVVWDTHLPNACVGYSPTQWLRWTLSYPIHETDRPAEIPVGQTIHPQKVTTTWLLVQAGFQLHMLYLATSNSVAIFVAQIQLSSRPRRSTGLAPASAIPLFGRSMQLWVSPRPPSSTIVLDAISSSRVRHSPRHPSRSAGRCSELTDSFWPRYISQAPSLS